MRSRNDCVVTRRDGLRRIWPDGVFGESRAQGCRFRSWRNMWLRSPALETATEPQRETVAVGGEGGNSFFVPRPAGKSQKRERWRKSPRFMRLFDVRSTSASWRKQAADEAAPGSATFGWRGKPDAAGASPRRTEAQRLERKPEVLGRQNAVQAAGAARQKPERHINGRREPQRSSAKDQPRRSTERLCDPDGLQDR